MIQSEEKSAENVEKKNEIELGEKEE